MRKLLMAFFMMVMGFGSGAYGVSVDYATPHAHSNSAASHSATAKADATASVNINSADEKTLATLKGIGQTKAKSIVDYRTKNGSFAAVEDLAKAKGFSKKTVDKLVKNNPGRVTVN